MKEIEQSPVKKKKNDADRVLEIKARGGRKSLLSISAVHLDFINIHKSVFEILI